MPQLRGQMGIAKSYAERLFDFPEIGPLNPIHARDALVLPLQKNQVDISDDATQRIIELTQGYPYFLQEWGKHTWDVASVSPITLEDVQAAEPLAIAALDASFLGAEMEH